MEEKFNEKYLEILLKLEDLQNKFEQLNKMSEKLKTKYLQNKNDEIIIKKIKETEKCYEKLLFQFEKLNSLLDEFSKNKTQGN